jgi:16S rRNA (uracil1498-N3)-methyltransferase
MTTPRVYFSHSIDINTELSLPPDISHHLINVLRLRQGDELILFNGCGGEFTAQLITAHKKSAVVKVALWQKGIAESPITINLAQGIMSGTKMDFVIQKAVELGVNYVTPLFTEFGGAKLIGERLSTRREHWQKIAIHASEQCGRCVIPQILAPQHLAEWCTSLDSLATALATKDLKVMLEPCSSKSFATLSEKEVQNKNVILLIGAEGGFSSSETALAQQHGFTACHLGPRILRAETAPIAALSILQARYGDI